MFSLDPTDIAQLRALLRNPQLPPEELACLLLVLDELRKVEEEEELS